MLAWSIDPVLGLVPDALVTDESMESRRFGPEIADAIERVWRATTPLPAPVRGLAPGRTQAASERILALTTATERIAEELAIDRETVSRYVRLYSKPAEAPPGSEEPKPAGAPPGSTDSKPAGAPPGSAATPSGQSDCEPLRAVIIQKLELGLTAKRIHQDLAEEGFEGSYWSVMRFVRRLRRTKKGSWCRSSPIRTTSAVSIA